MENAPVKIDRLLEPLLLETSDKQADEILLRLITDHAQPVIKGVIRYKLRLTSYGGNDRAESDDVYQDVILQLLQQLQQFRKQPEAHPISDARGMAAIIAHRTCSRWMRRQFPERHALKNRLHYLLTRQRGLALWQDKDGRLVAGFAVWQEQNKPARSAPIPSDVEAVAAHISNIKSGRQQELPDAVAAMLNHLGGPIEFDELVSALASLLGISDKLIESLDNDEEGVAFEPVAEGPDAAWRLEKRIFLQRLWEEVQELPLNQRAALLLNLKDASGSGCITLFPATGVATVRQLSEAVGMGADDFAKLWNDLPLEDARIAELLGVTRQQVINARKSGRERLARRLKGFF